MPWLESVIAAEFAGIQQGIGGGVAVVRQSQLDRGNSKSEFVIKYDFNLNNYIKQKIIMNCVVVSADYDDGIKKKNRNKQRMWLS